MSSNSFAYRLAVAAFFASITVSGTASAQGWLADRENTEGPGFRLGNLEIHPGVGAEVGWDSNVFYADQSPVDSGILRITPHIAISTLGPQRESEGEGQEDDDPPALDFRFGFAAPIYIYFVDAARSSVELEGNLALTILPERPFSIQLTDTLSRQIRPFTEAGADGRDYARIDNDAGIRFVGQSRGGVLKGGLGYNLLLHFFEGASFNYANSLTHRIGANTAWRFLPSTAMLYDFRLDIRDYLDLSAGSPSRLSDGQILRTRVGVNGAITNSLAMVAMVGYAASFMNELTVAENDTVVAQAELRWQATTSIRLSLGYDRDLHNSFVGGYYVRDRGFVDLRWLIAGSFLLGVNASVGNLGYGPQLTATGAPLGVGGVTDRNDLHLGASVFAEYRLTDWLALNASLGYLGNFTDFQYALTDAGGAMIIDPADYQKLEVFGGIRVFY